MINASALHIHAFHFSRAFVPNECLVCVFIGEAAVFLPAYFKLWLRDFQAL
mgnify:CR=1 FL=1